MARQSDFQKQLGSIEELVREVESSSDDRLRGTVQELVQLVMDMHGVGLQKILELVRAAGDCGAAILQRMQHDEAVSSLLVLHELHPMSLEERVMEGLDRARSRIKSNGGEVDLVSFQTGLLRLRVRGAGHGCGSSAESLKETVEDSLYDAAPDLTGLVVEGTEEKQSFVPVEMLLNDRNRLSFKAGTKGEL